MDTKQYDKYNVISIIAYLLISVFKKKMFMKRNKTNKIVIHCG